MVQNNRQLVRIFFILVIVAAFLGWWYASNFWQFDLDTFASPSSDGDGDWIDLLASIGEQLLQLFLNLASPAS